MAWWTWIIVGTLLLGLELFAVDAQFFLIFIGAGAIVVGLIGMLGIDLPVWMQWLLFAALSIAAMLTIRRQLYAALRKRPLAKVDGDADQRVRIPEELAARQVDADRVPRQRLDGAQCRRAADPGRRRGADRVRRRAHVARSPTSRRIRLYLSLGASMNQTAFLVALAIAIVVIIVLRKTAIVVPQQSAFIVEMLGKYSRTLSAGFHILAPFMERIAYRHSLKESAVDIPEQICITRDNVQVGIDGVLYLQVLDAARASYGIANYGFAITQLAQTTLRSEIGKIELDRTFEERAQNQHQRRERARQGVRALGRESAALRNQEHQSAARRDPGDGEANARRAGEARGDLDLRGRARREDQPGGRREAARDQGVGSPRQLQINEAQGEAEAILAVASATAEGLRRVAEAVSTQGGYEAMQLRVAEDYIQQFGNLARTTNTLVVPANLSDIAGMIAMATKVFDQSRPAGPGAPQAPSGAPPRTPSGAPRTTPSGTLPPMPR